MGATVIASASTQDAEWCRSLGARAAIEYTAGDLFAQIARTAPDGIDGWWDDSGRHDFAAQLPLMRQGECVVLMASIAAQRSLPIGAAYTRDISLRGFAISNASAFELAGARVINRLLPDGRLITGQRDVPPR